MMMMMTTLLICSHITELPIQPMFLSLVVPVINTNSFSWIGIINDVPLDDVLIFLSPPSLISSYSSLYSSLQAYLYSSSPSSSPSSPSSSPSFFLLLTLQLEPCSSTTRTFTLCFHEKGKYNVLARCSSHGDSDGGGDDHTERNKLWVNDLDIVVV
jgi:hypothetical protein